MLHLERLKQIGEELRGQFQKVVLEEKLLNNGEMIEIHIAVKPAPNIVSCVIDNYVDDSPSNQELLEKPISQMGFSVRTRKLCLRLFSSSSLESITLGQLI